MTTKLDRQIATAAMTKCDCGNVAPLNEELCNACQNSDDIRTQLLMCHSVDDIKEFIANHLI